MVGVAAVLSASCAAGGGAPGTSLDTPSAPISPSAADTQPQPGSPEPSVAADLGDKVNLTWPVTYDGKVIGALGVGHSDGRDAGIEAAFDPIEPLDQAASLVGADHFNWYQYVVKDTDPPRDASGRRLVAPFIDPPCGGYGGLDKDWADELPWYWDESEAPPGAGPEAEGNQLDANVEGDIVLFSDAPAGDPGTRLRFRTYLAGVGGPGSEAVFLGGWSWSFRIKQDSVVISQVRRLPTDAPSPAGFEDLLAVSSCRN